MPKVKDYIAMIRPRYSAYPLLAGFTGSILAYGQWSLESIFFGIIAGIINLLLWWAGMVSNHIFDAEIDYQAIQIAQKGKTIVPLKECRPLAMGYLSSREAWMFVLILYILAFSLSLLAVNRISVYCVLLLVTAGTFFYNMYAKHKGIWGSVIFAILIALTFAIGGTVGGRISFIHIIAMSMAVCFHINMHICGCIKDVDTDKEMGNCTFPVVVGIKTAANIAFLCYVLSYIVALIPFFLKLLSWIYLIPVIFSGVISFMALLQIYRMPRVESGWYALSKNIVSASLLYGSFSLGVISWQ